MAPIRVAIIGLSKSAEVSWASSAHYPYLIASNGKYRIDALCNSSKEAAQRAIEDYKLPATTKAYGNPQDLASDPDIDLVICSTRVDVHYPTIKPSIEAGKDVFVEWPLGKDIGQAQELARLAKEKNVKTMVGLQGRVSPIFLKVKELVQGGRIGKVLSSSFIGSGGTNAFDTIGQGLAYFFDRSVGGNLMTIYVGHLTDSIASALGPIKPTASKLSLLRPNIKVLSSSGEVLRTVQSNVPDLININGSLSSHNNAPFSYFFKRGPRFKGTPALIWSVHGETGEIRVEADTTSIHAVDDNQNVKILVENFESGEVENVTWKDVMADRGLKGPAKNIGSLYEAFAEGGNAEWSTFETALERHKFLEDVWGEWEA